MQLFFYCFVHSSSLTALFYIGLCRMKGGNTPCKEPQSIMAQNTTHTYTHTHMYTPLMQFNWDLIVFELIFFRLAK